MFLECALFVNKLASDSPTVWMEQNRDSPLVYNITKNIHKWGEAIAEKMRIVELKERDILLRLTKGKTDSEPSPCLPEEPVFPDEQDDSLTLDAPGESRSEKAANVGLQTISYAIKMSACILLLEITRFLRNPPDHFINLGSSISQVSTPRVSVTNIDRKISSASMVSTDTEAIGGGIRGATGSLGRPPRLGHFGSSLSVEDAEGSAFDYGRSVSIEEGGGGGGGGSSSPRKKRASVYLRVTATGGSSGGVSRTTSVRKQPRMVHLGGSTGSDHHSNQRSPSSSRRPRKSAALHTSFYTGTRSRRPSNVGSTTVGSYHPVPPKYRRKSVGAAVHLKEREIVQDSEFSPSFSSSHHPNYIAPSPSPTKASPSTSFLSSTSISIGQKLRRSAQRAFRRGHRSNSKRLHSEQALSPGSSPGPAPRKRLMSGRRPSVSAGSITQSIGPHLLTPEESRKKFPWLDIVEHIVLADSTNPESRVRHTQTCRALTAALGMIYSSTYEEESEENETNGNKRAPATTPKKSMSRSLSTLFAQQVSLVESDTDSAAGGQPVVRGGRFSQAPRSISLPSVRRRTLQKSRSITTVRLASVPSTMSVTPSLPSTSDPLLARLSFANMNYAQFTSSFLVATAPGSSEGGIELFLEEESSFPRPFLLAELDKQRRDYMRNEFQGLVHAPLSVLIHAAPILHDSTFTVLKSVVWNLLLDSDPELAKTAGMEKYYVR